MATSSSEPQGGGPALSVKTVERLLESVQLNRVTIVVGPTGCGKSALVPAALLDGMDGTGPILCTQPRRLAAVAVATRVAQNRHTTILGGSNEVGYHVGQSNHSVKQTSLLFATAGILLEDLRANGVEVLRRYECVLIDECHERSPESDLCLAVIKQLMRTHPTDTIRIVLMSATFDHERYTKYFAGVPGCEMIQTITLETAESFAAFYNRVDTLYLDDILPQLSNAKSHEVLKKTMLKNPDADLYAEGTDGGESLTFHLLHLISSLVSMLDQQEPSTAPFLIFAPTYRHLEQMYEHLQSNCQNLLLAVLHSSVDMEDCLRSINDPSSRRHAPSVAVASCWLRPLPIRALPFPVLHVSLTFVAVCRWHGMANVTRPKPSGPVARFAINDRDGRDAPVPDACTASCPRIFF